MSEDTKENIGIGIGCTFIIAFLICVIHVFGFAAFEYAEEAFVNTYSREYSGEIDYWEKSQVTQREYIGTCNGRQLVHLCNKILEKNDELKRSPFHVGPDISMPVNAIKNFAFDKIDKEVAFWYRYSGRFTSYDKVEKYYQAKYYQASSYILVIPKLRRILIFSGDRNKEDKYVMERACFFERNWFKEFYMNVKVFVIDVFERISDSPERTYEIRSSRSFDY